MIGDDHGERRTLLRISLPYSFTTDFDRGIEHVDDELKAFVLYLAAEFQPPLPLNQAELEYDVATDAKIRRLWLQIRAIRRSFLSVYQGTISLAGRSGLKSAVNHWSKAM